MLPPTSVDPPLPSRAIQTGINLFRAAGGIAQTVPSIAACRSKIMCSSQGGMPKFLFIIFFNFNV